MFEPDYYRLMMIHEAAIKKQVKELWYFLALSHISTNGFTFMSNGLFNERVDALSKDEITTIIDDSIDLWNSVVLLPCSINHASEMIKPGSQYTDTHIKAIVLDYYKQLLIEEDD